MFDFLMADTIQIIIYKYTRDQKYSYNTSNVKNESGQYALVILPSIREPFSAGEELRSKIMIQPKKSGLWY